MDKPRIKKREKLYRVSDIVDGVLNTMRGQVSETGGESLEEVQAAWNTIVGEKIIDNTTLVSLQQGVLVVSVKKSVWRNELEFMKAGIVKKINNNLGRNLIRNIILR